MLSRCLLEKETARSLEWKDALREQVVKYSVTTKSVFRKINYSHKTNKQTNLKDSISLIIRDTENRLFKVT